MTHPGKHPERTPEQHAAVRRRAFTVAIAANILAVAALVLLFTKTIAIHQPPNIMAANFSFCAVMMGVGILFYAKATPNTGPVRALCLSATLLGMVGPVLFAKQSVEWRTKMESTEIENVSAIAKAAEKFARDHNNAYPPDFATLLSEKYLPPETLFSPFGGQGTQLANPTRQTPGTPPPATMATPSDYTYTGGDLHLPLPPAAAAAIVVVYETDPVLREHFAVGFADGTAKILTLEDAEPVLKACNEARGTVGLPPLKKPESVERAQALQNQH